VHGAGGSRTVDNLDHGERNAQLPAEPSPERFPSAPVVSSRVAEVPRRAAVQNPVDATPLPQGTRHSEFEGRPIRESLLLAMRQQRTTLYEVGDLARRLSALTPALAEASLLMRQLAVSFAIALAVVLLGTMAIAAGAMRLVLGVLAGIVATTLAVFGALRLVSRLGNRRGTSPLPGSALIWVGGVVFVAVATTSALTWGVSEVTRPLVTSKPRAAPRASVSAVASTSPQPGAADARLKRGTHANVGRGVLYAPPALSAPDGRFDLVIHYHGNTELVEQSFAAAKVNALVLIVNYGEGAEKYSAPLQNQFAFDQLLGSIEATAEARLGLEKPRIRRIALASWSAGYGSLSQILSSRSRFDRVDAVLLMDSLHGSFAPGSKTEVYPPHIKPFVDFARRAAAGEKLMLVTHSTIETDGYASTTQTSNALLAALGIDRRAVTSRASSPKPVQFREALWAFPPGERRWLSIASEARQGNLTVLGCNGNGKGDHIAHLAQMSETVLPPLVERWR
jgi:hypothetical protein